MTAVILFHTSATRLELLHGNHVCHEIRVADGNHEFHEIRVAAR